MATVLRGRNRPYIIWTWLQRQVSGSEPVWIMERPTVDGSLPDLADYRWAVMSSASARKANAARHEGYVAYQGPRNKQISMVNGANILSTVTPIDANSMRLAGYDSTSSARRRQIGRCSYHHSAWFSKPTIPGISVVPRRDIATRRGTCLA
jgi:hypothetical protein